MKNGEKYSRKSFLNLLFWAGLSLPFLQYCIKKGKGFLLKVTGTNSILGHRLWAKDFPKPTEEIITKFLIVGAGISGLSACRFFAQNNETDFLLLDMEDKVGGNSSNGENQFSKFPLGAHYLPFPNKEDQEIIAFLKESKMYLGDDENGNPILDDEQLTFPQQERLFFKNTWQNDLLPQTGISEETKKEYHIFFKMMDEFRTKKDDFGKYWFDIPIHNSSKEQNLLDLEKITFENWLHTKNLKSEELLWYLDYSCRDDFGLGIKSVSAWIGIHYFAGRKNNWVKNREDQVFSWPEGNARLAKHLSKFSSGNTLTQNLAYQVEINNDKVEVLVFDDLAKKSKKIIADKVLFSTPQFVNQYIFKDRKLKNFKYSPWLLSTITLKNEFGGEVELAWDNVIYGTKGLGYIYDQHQNLNQNLSEKVITYYKSFSEEEVNKSRKKLFSLTEEELKKIVLDELKLAHPLIEDYILEMSFHKIGHGIIAPIPNQIFGEESENLRKNIDDRIYFAHSDLSGISIFEEAFHQGTNAAKQIL